MAFRCKHDYEIIKEYEIESVMERLIKRGLKSMERTNIAMMQSKLIIVYKCKKCNKLFESEHSNID